MKVEPETYSVAVGRFLRSYRASHSLTLDAVARAGREFGAKWRLSSVQSIEDGTASPTLPTLLTLALALGWLTGEPLRLSDLLGDAERLDRPGPRGRPVSRAWVDQALSGAPIATPPATGSDRLPYWGHLEVPIDTQRERYLREVYRGASQAEYRAATQLGCHPSDVQFVAMMMWGGRTIDEESARRAGEGASPQKRGRITRQLIEEMRATRETGC